MPSRPFLRNYFTIILLVLFSLVFITFSPVLINEFITYDDPKYITQNEYIKNLTSKNISDIFFHQKLEGRAYAPLTLITFAIEYHFVELSPLLYHFNNLLIHCLNSLLLFWLVFLITDGKIFAAFATALLSGIHPMRVESVAWACERKDVLYTFFYFCALICYVKFSKSDKFHLRRYVLSLLFFQLSILSKGMAVSLPVVMVLIDFLTGRTIPLKKNIFEKLPFFILSVFWGIFTIKAGQDIETIGDTGSSQWFYRSLYASYAFLCYLYRFVAPLNLSLFYPYPPVVAGKLPFILYVAPFMVIALVVLVYFSIKKTKVVFFSISCFLAAVVMVLQFLPVGPVITADHYSYLANTFLFFMTGYFLNFLHEKYSANSKTVKILFLSLTVSYALCLAFLTHQRCKVWKDSLTILNDALSKYEHAIPYLNRGNVYFNRGEDDLAMADYNKSIALFPNHDKGFGNRGAIYVKRGQYDLGLKDLNHALLLNKNYPDAYLNRAVLFSITDQLLSAKSDYDKYLSTVKNNPSAWNWRGTILQKLGEHQSAINDFTIALQLNSQTAVFYYNRSHSWHALGNIQNARQDAAKAKELGWNVEEGYLKELGI